MTRRERDYRREYQERIQRAATKGLSRSQARGHARAGELSISAKVRKRLEDNRIQNAIRSMSKGESLAKSARDSGLSEERLRKFVSERKLAKKKGRNWILVKRRLRWQWTIFSEGRLQTIVVSDPETSSVIGKYLNAVRKLLTTNNAKALRRFKNVRVKDVTGRTYRLETDENTLFRLDHAERETPEDFYRYAV
jgi:hypothetical protein